MPIQAPNEKPAIQTPRESGMERLDPVERRGGIGKLADAVVEIALAPANTAEIEAEAGEAALLEHVEQAIDDLVVHRAAEAGMRMQHQRDRRRFRGRGLITPLEPAVGSCKNHFRHE